MINKDGQKQIPEKGPVMLLYELFNNVNIECASTQCASGAQHSRFKMIATVNDKKFEGTGLYQFLIFINLFVFINTIRIRTLAINRKGIIRKYDQEMNLYSFVVFQHFFVIVFVIRLGYQKKSFI